MDIPIIRRPIGPLDISPAGVIDCAGVERPLRPKIRRRWAAEHPDEAALLRLLIRRWAMRRSGSPTAIKDMQLRTVRAMVAVGMCPVCGYDIGGSPEREGRIVCPECGALWPARWPEDRCDALMPEEYSTRRQAEFLLNNATDADDYQRARAEVEAMGLNPDEVPHQRL